MKRVFYLSHSEIPSRAANFFHVTQMCEALSLKGYEVTLVGIPGSLEQKNLTPSPYKTIQISENIWSRQFGYAWKSAQLAHQGRADLVIARHIVSAYFAAKRKIPLFMEIHNLNFEWFERIFLGKILKSPSLIKLIVISQALKEDLIKNWGIPTKKIVVLPDGVNLKNYEEMIPSLEAKKNLEVPQQFTVGYVGHLYRGRGIDLILNLAAHPDHQDCYFLIVGGNEKDIQYYRNLAAQRKIRNIHFLGFISQKKLPLVYSACDVLLMPYQKRVSVALGGNDTSRWMSPMKMFEYLASKKPIISSDHPVLREVLTDKNAILVDSQNFNGWNDALQFIKSNPEKAERLARNAKQTVQKYSWLNRVSKMEKIVEENSWT